MKKKCGVPVPEEVKLGVWFPFIILIWANTFVCIKLGEDQLATVKNTFYGTHVAKMRFWALGYK